jgi:RNA polymerase sigma factor (sigma-70 family)
MRPVSTPRVLNVTVGSMIQPSVVWPAQELICQLMREAQHDSGRALNHFLGTLRPALVAFFEQRLPLDVAEDLTQLALIRVAGALGRIDPQRGDRYIKTVARNLLRTTYRHRARERARTASLDGDGVTQPRVEAVDTRAEYEELVRAIHRASLLKLAPPLRDIVARLVREQSPSEIAAELQISPITVRTRLIRIRAVLRRELGSLISRDPIAKEVRTNNEHVSKWTRPRER